MANRTQDGRPFRIHRECLASVVARRLGSQEVNLLLAELFLQHDVPRHIRSDNGPEFIARKLRRWLKTLQVEPLRARLALGERLRRIAQWQMRDQFLNGELFYTLKEEKNLIQRWRIHYNTVRPHSGLGGQPLAPETLPLAS